jgi:hypothetical protein
VEATFLVDVNVARLADWLRALGYDAALSPGLDDSALILRALEEGRILLTRDTRLMQRRAVARGALQALLVESDRHWDQLRQVVAAFGLDTTRAFSRCIRCNTVQEQVPKDAVRERVPPYVYRTQETFKRCPSCDRVYWQGSHWHNMRAELKRLLGEKG